MVLRSPGVPPDSSLEEPTPKMLSQLFALPKAPVTSITWAPHWASGKLLHQWVPGLQGHVIRQPLRVAFH